MKASAAWLLATVLIALPARGADVGFIPINHSRFSPLPPTEVWSRLHDFIQNQGFDVTKEDQSSGIIESRRQTGKSGGLKSFADCPTKLFWSPKHEVIDLNILLKPTTDGTRVIVNAAFLQTGAPGKKGAPSLACVSQGVLESAVLDVANGQPMEAAIIPR
jgi:hypothetical protein